MKLSVYHFRRSDDLIVTVFAEPSSELDSVKADVEKRHGSVSVVEKERNIVPDWRDIQIGFKTGNFKKVGR